LKSKELETAIMAAKKAGDYLKKEFGKPFKAEQKKDIFHSWVTEIDKEAEKIIRKELEKEFPLIGFIGEESKADYKPAGNWVVDPIDGTHNYMRKIPIFGVSIALEKNEEITLGVVYLPMLNELYYAEKGKGAFKNDKKINVSNIKGNLNSIIAIPNYFIQQTINEEKKIQNTVSHFPKTRTFGSLVFGGTALSSGKIEAIVHPYANYWDLAASKIILEESGGKATDWQGKPYSKNTKKIVFSNNLIHEMLLNKLK